MFETHDEQESPNEGACLGYMMHRNRQLRRLVSRILC